MNYQWVAGRFENVRRRTLLSWGHHEAVSGLPPEQGDELLLRAEVEGWSRQDLRQRVRDAKNDSTAEVEVGEMEPSGMAVHFSSASPEWSDEPPPSVQPDL